jgi:DNA/RNA-binding domain of Phe-tRNA-synthetase-like protein
LIELEPSEEVRVLLTAGVAAASPVKVEQRSPALAAEMDELASSLAERYAGLAPAEIDALAPARELYKSFGMDPTKTRPSSEALLRRVLKGKPLPVILNAVDLCNYLSLSFMLPLGLYDSGKIEGPVLLRRGRPGETFAGIRKGDVHLEGRPVLADRQGPFGNPTSDSLRTSVDGSTSELWLVIFAPASLAREVMERHVAKAGSMMARHLSPGEVRVKTSGLVPA